MNGAVLNPRLTARLTELETVIERGLSTFVEVGEALVEIRGSRLYRETDATFEAYCKRRWGFTDRRARQLMDSAQVARAINAGTDTFEEYVERKTGTVVPVANEAQARALAPVLRESGPEAVREAWQEAVETAPEGRVTAAHVEAVTHRRARPVVVVVERPPMRVLVKALERELGRLRDGYAELLSDEAFAARFGCVFAAIDAALEG